MARVHDPHLFTRMSLAMLKHPLSKKAIAGLIFCCGYYKIYRYCMTHAPEYLDNLNALQNFQINLSMHTLQDFANQALADGSHPADVATTLESAKCGIAAGLSGHMALLLCVLAIYVALYDKYIDKLERDLNLPDPPRPQ